MVAAAMARLVFLRVGGTEFRLHGSALLLLLAAVGWGLAEGGVRGGGWGAASWFLVMASALNMELGRRYLGLRAGLRSREVLLTPLGGVSRVAPTPTDRASCLAYGLGSLAGPAVLLWAVELILLAHGAGPPTLRPWRGQLLAELFWVNLTLGALHAVPLLPFGLGRYLTCRRRSRGGGPELAFRSTGLTRGGSVLLALAGLWLGLGWTLFGVVLFAYAGEEQRLVTYEGARITGRFGQQY